MQIILIIIIYNYIKGQIHSTAEKDDVGWKVGKDYAKWGDELFKDPAKKQELIQILEPLVTGTFETGGYLLKRAMKAILCDRLGLGKLIPLSNKR